MAPVGNVAEWIRAVPSAAAALDLDLRYIAANEHWCTLHDTDSSAFLGRRLQEFLPKRDWLTSPWRDETGTLRALVMHVERVGTLGGLGHTDTFVHRLFDDSPIGLNLCRLDGLWLESNRAFLDMIGYSAEEADGGMTYWQLTPSEFDEQERVQLDAISRDGRYGPYEKEFIRKDGSRIPVRLNGFMIEHEGQQLIWSLIEDISDQRRLERELRQQRAAAEQAARLASIGEMAAGVAHEINNPLQIIEAAAFELQCAYEDGTTPSLESIVAVREASARAAAIVRSLRKFGREDVPEITPNPVQALIDEALNLTLSRFRSHGVTLEVDVQTTRTIRCTPLEMTQVLVNLLNNAFDSVVASQGHVWIDAFDEADQVVIRVRDSGDGVAESLRERIFDPFFTTKPVGVGMGLGLSISKRIIDSLGGTLTCSDTPQSAFTLRLPSEEDR